METLRNVLAQQPMMALFLTIALGYLLGEVNIKGFSLGVGAVLFVALFMGWLSPKSAPAPMVQPALMCDSDRPNVSAFNWPKARPAVP